jgi:hypothetical protein
MSFRSRNHTQTEPMIQNVRPDSIPLTFNKFTMSGVESCSPTPDSIITYEELDVSDPHEVLETSMISDSYFVGPPPLDHYDIVYFIFLFYGFA